MDFDSDTQRLIDDFVWARREMKEPDDDRLNPKRCHLARIKKKWWKVRWDHWSDDFYPKQRLLKFVANLDHQRKTGSGLLLHGTTGKGKTSAAMLIAKEIIRRDGFPLVVDAWEIPKIEIEDKELAHKMHATSFLIIDDLGAGAGKEASQAFVEQLVRDRDARELPMIITTNLLPSMEEEIPEEDKKDKDKTLGKVVGEACARVILERCMKVKFE